MICFLLLIKNSLINSSSPQMLSVLDRTLETNNIRSYLHYFLVF